MQGLNSHITGHWVEITQAAIKLNSLNEYFKLTPDTLKNQAQNLKDPAHQPQAFLYPEYNRGEALLKNRPSPDGSASPKGPAVLQRAGDCSRPFLQTSCPESQPPPATVAVAPH